MLNIQDRREFERFFEEGKNWGTLKDTLRIGIQLFSTRFQIGPLCFKVGTDIGAQVRCKSCYEFLLRFYQRIDHHWYVSKYVGHGFSCTAIEPDEPNYFMKPKELAMLLKPHLTSPLSQPADLVAPLQKLGLFPVSHSPQQVYTLTSSIMQVLRSSKKPPISLPTPSSSRVDSHRQRNQDPALAFQMVLQGLTSFRQQFLMHDPDNRLFIDTSEDGTYKRSTMIIGPVARLSKVHSTGQYDVDGTYFKLSTKITAPSLRLPGFIKGIVYSDANNCYYPLAIQHDCVEESEDGYRQLLENLWREFPHTASETNAYGSDRDTGLLAFIRNRNDEGLSTPNFIHCTVHLQRNVRAKYPGKEKRKQREKAVLRFQKIVYCKRKDQTLKRLGQLQTLDSDLYEYMMNIGPEFYCDALMTRFRPEKLTSNSVESLWSKTKDVRQETRLPLFFQSMYNFAVNKMFKIEQKAMKHQEDFTLCM